MPFHELAFRFRCLERSSGIRLSGDVDKPAGPERSLDFRNSASAASSAQVRGDGDFVEMIKQDVEDGKSELLFRAP